MEDAILILFGMKRTPSRLDSLQGDAQVDLEGIASRPDVARDGVVDAVLPRGRAGRTAVQGSLMQACQVCQG